MNIGATKQPGEGRRMTGHEQRSITAKLVELEFWGTAEPGDPAGDYHDANTLRARVGAKLAEDALTVSLPCGTSAFDRGQYTRRVHRLLIEGASPSIRIRSRFPLHPSLSALDGVSIEGKR